MKMMTYLIVKDARHQILYPCIMHERGFMYLVPSLSVKGGRGGGEPGFYCKWKW